MGKKILFTTNQLALAMGLEIGKKYKNSDGDVFVCGMKDKDVCLYSGLGFDCQLYLFIDEELTEVDPNPQLTETEITILKGRLAEGYTSVLRQPNGYSGHLCFNDAGRLNSTTGNTNALFQFVKVGEEYSIEALLKGTEK